MTLPTLALDTQKRVFLYIYFFLSCGSEWMFILIDFVLWYLCALHIFLFFLSIQDSNAFVLLVPPCPMEVWYLPSFCSGAHHTVASGRHVFTTHIYGVHRTFQSALESVAECLIFSQLWQMMWGCVLENKK